MSAIALIFMSLHHKFDLSLSAFLSIIHIQRMKSPNVSLTSKGWAQTALSVNPFQNSSIKFPQFDSVLKKDLFLRKKNVCITYIHTYIHIWYIHMVLGEREMEKERETSQKNGGETN